MQEIQFEEYPKENFKSDSIVILLHGIGADGFDLLPLAKYWSKKLINTKFYSLHAPFEYNLGGVGKQWFDLQDRDQTRILNEIELIKPMLINFFNKKIEENKIFYKKLILVGFSQGTMVALNIGISIKEKIKSILGYSGGIILSKSGKINITSKPNICLIHGEKDEVVPSRMMITSKSIFEENNFSIETHLIDNLGHSIDNKGLDIGQKFLINNLK